jgi:hypothetical protein
LTLPFCIVCLPVNAHASADAQHSHTPRADCASRHKPDFGEKSETIAPPRHRQDIAKTLPRDITGRMAPIRLPAKKNRKMRRKHGCHQPLTSLVFYRCDASRPQQSKTMIFLNNEA